MLLTRRKSKIVKAALDEWQDLGLTCGFDLQQMPCRSGHGQEVGTTSRSSLFVFATVP